MRIEVVTLPWMLRVLVLYHGNQDTRTVIVSCRHDECTKRCVWPSTAAVPAPRFSLYTVLPVRMIRTTVNRIY